MSCDTKVVVFVYVVCRITFSFFPVWVKALLLNKYTSFIVAMVFVGVKEVTLFFHTPVMKNFMARVTKPLGKGDNV